MFEIHLLHLRLKIIHHPLGEVVSYDWKIPTKIENREIDVNASRSVSIGRALLLSWSLVGFKSFSSSLTSKPHNRVKCWYWIWRSTARAPAKSILNQSFYKKNFNTTCICHSLSSRSRVSCNWKYLLARRSEISRLAKRLWRDLRSSLEWREISTLLILIWQLHLWSPIAGSNLSRIRHQQHSIRDLSLT